MTKYKLTMETIKYKTRSMSSLTPCPHGIRAECHNAGIRKPLLVHVGSWMEVDCPHFVADDAKRKEVTCNYTEGELFSFYVSR